MTALTLPRLRFPKDYVKMPRTCHIEWLGGNRFRFTTPYKQRTLHIGNMEPIDLVTLENRESRLLCYVDFAPHVQAQPLIWVKVWDPMSLNYEEVLSCQDVNPEFTVKVNVWEPR